MTCKIFRIEFFFHSDQMPGVFVWLFPLLTLSSTVNSFSAFSPIRIHRQNYDKIVQLKMNKYKDDWSLEEDGSIQHENLRKSASLQRKEKGMNEICHAEATLDTALCIIPPFEAWDDIQRARHYAKDPSFYTFPPAIRLFHPFAPYHNQRNQPTQDVAMSIAQVIEKYQLEPFNCTLDKLVIVPHFEELERSEEEQRNLPVQHADTEQEDKEKDDVQSLIEKEEAKGRKKLAKRKENLGKSTGNQVSEVADTAHSTTSPKDILSKQRKALSEFNGPCVLCLEPNEESKIHIQAFREILRKKLFPSYDPFSPSSTVTSAETLSKQRQRYKIKTGVDDSNGQHVLPGMDGLPKSILKQHGMLRRNRNTNLQRKKKDGVTFRPLITLGRFSTVTKAVSIAKQLQKQWEPLTFRVTDLHLVSKLETGGVKVGHRLKKDGTESNGYSISYGNSDDDSIDKQSYDDDFDHAIETNREKKLRRIYGTDSDRTSLSNEGEYGCDAMIMLLGEEWQLLQSQARLESNAQDCESLKSKKNVEEEEDQMFQLLMSDAASPSGELDTNIHFDPINPIINDLSNAEDIDEEYLYHLLDEDDEEIDHGATIVIGRTQFMLGAMRQFVGMPASSTIDGKDRTVGDDVSGSARRRGAVHRQGNRWVEGDFGQKEKDYLP